MATRQLTTSLRATWADKRRITDAVAGESTDEMSTPGNFTDMTALDTRLTAIDSTRYAAKNLEAMTHNDKLYALRVADESSGV